MSIPSGIARFSVFVQSTDWCTLKYFRYHPRLAPDNYIPMHSTSFLLADILLQTHPRQPKQRFHPFSKYNSPIVPLDLSGEQNLHIWYEKHSDSTTSSVFAINEGVIIVDATKTTFKAGFEKLNKDGVLWLVKAILTTKLGPW